MEVRLFISPGFCCHVSIVDTFHRWKERRALCPDRRVRRQGHHHRKECPPESLHSRWPGVRDAYSFQSIHSRHLSVSQVTVTIKNQGEYAYRHEAFSDSITITRRFTRTGESTYTIKSTSGNTVSTKREEVAAICDHMNIQVDNPLNILTQDSAR